jgi:SAM-dependent methyltransferase
LSVAVDRWTGGDDYEAYVGRWSRPVAEQFVEWLAIPAGGNWVDVGCGTGALSGEILRRSAPAALVGVDPSAAFVAYALATIGDPRAGFLVGSASALPVANRWADAVVAGLVLNFVPDIRAALHEMARVASPRAVVGGYVWDYADGMQLIRRFFDAAVELDPAAVAQDEGVRFPICAPGPLGDAFKSAGLERVAVRSIEVATVFSDFDDYWTPFLNGVGPARGYVVGLDEGSRAELCERLRATLPTEADGSIHLMARAWAVRGSVPGGSR